MMSANQEIEKGEGKQGWSLHP